MAWGTTWGRSPALCIAKIAKIRYFTRHGSSYGSTKECDRARAEGYHLVLEPIKSTGDVTFYREDGTEYREYVDGPADQHKLTAKHKTIKHVKNVVLLEAFDADAA